MKRYLYCYVNERYVGQVRTSWPIMRALAALRRQWPNADTHEVTAERLPAEPTVPVLCSCGWGNLAIVPADIPEHCPVCGFNLAEYFDL